MDATVVVVGVFAFIGTLIVCACAHFISTLMAPVHVEAEVDPGTEAEKKFEPRIKWDASPEARVGDQVTLTRAYDGVWHIFSAGHHQGVLKIAHRKPRRDPGVVVDPAHDHRNDYTLGRRCALYVYGDTRLLGSSAEGSVWFTVVDDAKSAAATSATKYVARQREDRDDGRRMLIDRYDATVSMTALILIAGLHIIRCPE